MKKLTLILFVCLGLSTILNAQDFNIAQTLEYINNKLNSNKASMDKNTSYVWEIANDGKLTITQYINEEWNFSQTVFLKALDKDKIFINEDNFFQTDYYFTIHVRCKEDREDVLKKYQRYIRSSTIFVRLAPDVRTAAQIKNAIAYLITLAEKKQEYKSKETDPFDYSKQ